MLFRDRKRNKGFTLIETLVAISVLMIAVVGPLTLAQEGLSSALYAKDQVIAIYLAQEGLEAARYQRDLSTAEGLDWLNGLGSCEGSDGCRIDATTMNITQCNGDCAPLRYDTEDYFYGYDANWEETKFTRTIYINEVSDHEVEVAVTVSWRSALIPREFTVRENMLDWQS